MNRTLCSTIRNLCVSTGSTKVVMSGRVSSCMCDSLVGWTTGRETPSVAGVIQPGSEGFQKLFFGQEEIAVPVYSRYCILFLQNENWSLTSAEFSFVPSCFSTHMEAISLIWCCSSHLKYFFSFVLCDIFFCFGAALFQHAKFMQQLMSSSTLLPSAGVWSLHWVLKKLVLKIKKSLRGLAWST
jgi:hypothetical protein